MQSRGKGGMAAKRAKCAEYGQERLLRQIFGFGSVFQHPKTKGKDARAVQAIEQLKGGGVASLSPSNRFGFLRIRTPYFFASFHKPSRTRGPPPFVSIALHSPPAYTPRGTAERL